MSIFSSFFSGLKQKFSQKKQQSCHADLSLLPLVPNPLIPWEVYPDIDPNICLFTQGNESTWLCEIWYPYWESLTEEEKTNLKEQAPTESWREWLDWRSEGAKKTRIYRENAGLPFDYHTYLHEFKINYIKEYIQNKN